MTFIWLGELRQCSIVSTVDAQPGCELMWLKLVAAPTADSSSSRSRDYSHGNGDSAWTVSALLLQHDNNCKKKQLKFNPLESSAPIRHDRCVIIHLRSWGIAPAQPAQPCHFTAHKQPKHAFTPIKHITASVITATSSYRHVCAATITIRAYCSQIVWQNQPW